MRAPSSLLLLGLVPACFLAAANGASVICRRESVIRIERVAGSPVDADTSAPPTCSSTAPRC